MNTDAKILDKNLANNTLIGFIPRTGHHSQTNQSNSPHIQKEK